MIFRCRPACTTATSPVFSDLPLPAYLPQFLMGSEIHAFSSQAYLPHLSHLPRMRASKQKLDPEIAESTMAKQTLHKVCMNMMT